LRVVWETALCACHLYRSSVVHAVQARNLRELIKLCAIQALFNWSKRDEWMRGGGCVSIHLRREEGENTQLVLVYQYSRKWVLEPFQIFQYRYISKCIFDNTTVQLKSLHRKGITKSLLQWEWFNVVGVSLARLRCYCSEKLVQTSSY